MVRELEFKPLEIDWDKPVLEVKRKKSKPGHLGVSKFFSYEKNQEIALNALIKDSWLAEEQIRYLKAFPWVHHLRGKNFYSGCRCLSCRLLYDLDLE